MKREELSGRRNLKMETAIAQQEGETDGITKLMQQGSKGHCI